MMGAQAPIKILVTTPWAQRLGGAENMLWTFLRRVDRSRVEPVVVLFEDGSFEREIADLGIRTFVVPTGRLRELSKGIRAVRSLVRLIRRERPDLLLNWMPKTHVYGGSAAILTRMSKRVVWWQHGVPDGHWLDRLATRFPARAVGCSSQGAALAQAHLRPHRETFVVHPGVDPVDLPPVAVVNQVRDEIRTDSGRPVVGIVGRLQPWKGQHEFLRAVAMLHTKRIDVHGLIVGGNAWNLSPGYERELHDLALGLGLSESVTFTGQVEDALPYIAAMDVLVNASAEEPFGIVLVEAMALGVPVVAVDAAGPREIVENGRTGILVSQPSHEELARALEHLLRDAPWRKSLGEAGRERFHASFGAAAMTIALEDRLREFARET
jgi:glycosyltransferase involved in cell wall biosynthesis